MQSFSEWVQGFARVVPGLPVVLGLVACDGAAARVADAAADREAGVTDAGEGPDGGMRDVARIIDAWCPTLAERYCQAAQDCDCASVPGFSDSPCVERAERGCRNQLEGLRAAVEGGRLEVASSLPAGCLVALDEALSDCRMPASDLFAVRCPIVWPSGASRDLPQPGAACFEGLCAEGARCSALDACEAPSSGQPCASEVDCPEAEVCGEAGACRARDFSASGMACSGPDACAGDALCLASARRECQPKVSAGPCASDDACPLGEFCDGAVCAPAPGLDAACGNGVWCAVGLACRFAPGVGEGTCQPLPQAGEFCALGSLGPFVCAEGLACRERTCGPVPTEGMACAVGALRCAEGLGCHVEDADSVCRPRVAAGAACGLDDSCDDGLYCNFRDNRCAPWAALGEACRDGNECGPAGACVPNETSEFRCVSRPGSAEACFLDDSCQAGLACRSPFAAGACASPLCAAFTF